MSKGSRSRPVDKKKFDENFDKIFGKKEKETTITVSVFGTEAPRVHCTKRYNI